MPLRRVAKADKTEDKAMTKLNMNELTNVTGGDSSDLFLLYAEYLDTLFEKYGIRGVKNIKKVCTPEEKAKIREMWKEVLNAA